LLRRAAYGLLSQTFKNFEWIVVTDGGPAQPAERLAKLFERSGIRAQTFCNEKAYGMEAASNQGLEVASGKYFMIHDDDDSLPPNFLEEVVKLLELREDVDAVVSNYNLIIETLDNGQIEEVQQTQIHVPEIKLKSLAQENMWPPIAMMVRTKVLEKIGRFDETLSVLGDWDFNLRLLANSNILHEPTVRANYHHRQDHFGPYSNTVVGQKKLHYETKSVVISKWKNDSTFPELQRAFND
jgi:glycosyltransferase involved in cell wall biosynthesis